MIAQQMNPVNNITLTTLYSHDKLNLIYIILTGKEKNMEPTEKDIVIGKIMEMPEEQVKKLLIFIAGLEAGDEISNKITAAEAGKGQSVTEQTVQM
jgi:hypothetical protein